MWVPYIRRRVKFEFKGAFFDIRVIQLSQFEVQQNEINGFAPGKKNDHNIRVELVRRRTRSIYGHELIKRMKLVERNLGVQHVVESRALQLQRGQLENSADAMNSTRVMNPVNPVNPVSSQRGDDVIGVGGERREEEAHGPAGKIRRTSAPTVPSVPAAL